MSWTFYNSSGEAMIIDGGVQNPMDANLDISTLKIVGNGGSTGITISANGEVNMAKQPAFCYFAGANDLNITGNGTVAVLEFNTKVVDQNDDFTSNTTFTAPVTGVYLFTFVTRLFGVTGAADTVNVDIVTTNNTYRKRLDDTNNIRANSPWTMTAIALMTGGDTAFAKITVTGESGDVNDAVGGSATSDGTVFSGVLLA